MPSLRDSLDASTARRFKTGRACLDFAHTGGVGNYMAAELIHTSTDASYWLALVLDLNPQDIAVTSAEIEPLRGLREAIWQLAQAATAGHAFGSEHVTAVNEAALAAPPMVEMTSAGGRRSIPTVDGSQALSALARDAIDLFTGPLSHRVRTCAADDCELLLVDSSRPGQRRWCSMTRCGSRDKMRRYRGS